MSNQIASHVDNSEHKSFGDYHRDLFLSIVERIEFDKLNSQEYEISYYFVPNVVQKKLSKVYSRFVAEAKDYNYKIISPSQQINEIHSTFIINFEAESKFAEMLTSIGLVFSSPI